MKKLRLNKSLIPLIFYAIFLFSKIQTRFEQPLYDDNIVVMIYAIGIVVLALISGSLRSINKKIVVLFAILIGYVALYNTLFRNDNLSSYLNSYSLAFVAFTLSIFFSAIYFSRVGKTYAIIKISYWVIVLTLIIMYVINFDNFETLKSLPESIFQAVRDRSNFGFTHANTTAAIALTGLLLWMLLHAATADRRMRERGHVIKLVYILSVLFLGFILISTVSKGTILAGAFGICMYAYYCRGREDRASRQVKIFLGVIFVLLIVAVAYVSLIQTGLLEIDYRLQNFTINIPTLIQAGRIYTGWGFVDKAVFSNGLVINGTGYTDNYYLYVLVSTGIVGCCIMVIYFLYMLHSLKKSLNCKSTFASKHLRSAIYSFIGTDLVLCLTEASFYHPASIFSFITMLIFLMCIIQNKNFLVEETEE